MARVEAAGLVVESCRFFKCAFFPLLLLLAKLERMMAVASIAEPRDNFYTIPPWLNWMLSRAIVLEDRSGITRVAPFGVSLLAWVTGDIR